VRHGGLAVHVIVGRFGSLVLVDRPLHFSGQRRLQSAGSVAKASRLAQVLASDMLSSPDG
jgi:hypothetical protein